MVVWNARTGSRLIALDQSRSPDEAQRNPGPQQRISRIALRSIRATRSTKQKARATARAFPRKSRLDQAAGLNSFDALVLIGSTVSVAPFWLKSAGCFGLAGGVSYCLFACEGERPIAAGGGLTPNSSAS